MTLFWIAGVALGALALALLLRPLLARRDPGEISRKEANLAIYRDQLRELEADLAAGKLAQADHDRARVELEARLLEDMGSVDSSTDAAPSRRGERAALLGLAAAVPVLAIVVYLATGSPAALGPQADPHAGVSVPEIEAMVERLAAKMRENPDDPEGWKLLGRSYAVMGRFAEAADAYAKASQRAPRDAQLLADFADALAMARGQSLEGEPEKLVQRALEIDPANLKALALAGTIEFNRGSFAAAASYWKRMLPQVEPGSEDARTIQGNIDEALAQIHGKPAKEAASLSGTVSLAAGLKDKASPEDTVFLYARAAEGPQMPLAVQRFRVRDLPAKFSLSDAMAMAPGATLSAHERVIVTARVSKSGQAIAQPGDLQGTSAPVANDASAVNVLIDTVVR
ncbi:MAG TPA: c-type cytochrome biogenesis protein CcmI [Burkholderiales bacterium]|nr:c-type cytochrome biogenesis protein CcmI [Burkholderiales bacterium]